MKQRYCPYCDQKMTSGLYCSGCKRIVWHPYVQDVDYYLNERHPQHESDCLYHDGGSEYPGSRASSTDSYAGVFKGNGTSTSTQGGKKKTNREKKAADPFQNMGNRMTGQRNAFEHMKSQLEQYRSQADTCQSGTYSSQSAKNIMDRVNSERGRKKPFTGILIVVIIWLVFSVGGNLLFLITHAIRESIYGIENIFDSSSGDLWSSADSNAVEVLGEGELSDEEVRAIGTNCTNYGHYDAQLADVTAALDRLLPQYGFSEWSMEDTYSYNYASDDMSWYNTDQACYLSRDGEYVGSITIYADTATDDLHGIGAYSSDEEAFYQIVDVLEATFQEFGYLDTDLSGQEVYQELINTEDMIVSKTDDSVNGFTTAYGPEIFASKESPSGDDFYSIQMYAPGYYTSVE
ncbi:MAG: hypothetical protein ACLVGK_12220 [Pilosibacter sp.]